MKSTILKAASTTVLALSLGTCFAQNAIQPGRLSDAAKTDVAPVLLPVLNSSSVKPSNLLQTAEDRHDRKVNRIWLGSIFALVAATSMDAASSWGKYETNPILASANGRFGAKGVSIKAGVAAGTIVSEILLRKHNDLKTKFVIGNLAETALFSTAAVHNFGVAAAK